jgi:hypothetical protein
MLRISNAQHAERRSCNYSEPQPVPVASGEAKAPGSRRKAIRPESPPPLSPEKSTALRERLLSSWLRSSIQTG